MDARQLPLPSGMKVPAHQVTGHFFGDSKLGLLECEDGTIAKPCESPKRGVRERKFYQSIFSPDIVEPTVLQLRRIVPQFLGIFNVQEHPNVPYIRLENLIHNIFHPCVMDVKIGAKSYDPEATAEKIKKESEKCPYQVQMGFRLAGMRIYQTEKMNYIVSEKSKLRAITPTQFLTQSLSHFLGAAKSFLPCILMSILRKLVRIQCWFTKQKAYAFYSSSIFFVYEGDILRHPKEPCIRCIGNVERCLSILRQHNISTQYLAQNSFVDKSCSSYSQHSTACGNPLKTNQTSNASESESTTLQTENHGRTDSTISINKDTPSANKDNSDTLHSNVHLQNGYISNIVPQLPQVCFEKVVECLSGDDKLCEMCDEFTDVRMIDFAHVFHTEETDEHYLHGLNNLIHYFIIFLFHSSNEGR